MILCRHQFFQVKEVEDGYWFKCKYCNTQVHGKIAMHNPYQGGTVVHKGATGRAKAEVASGSEEKKFRGQVDMVALPVLTMDDLIKHREARRKK